MGLFGRHEEQFRRSPLSPCVPLDGTESVMGLQTLNRLQRAGIDPFQPNPPSDAAERTRRPRAYQRYRGPYLDQLTVEDIKRPAAPWKQFFYNGEHGKWSESYNVPEDLAMLQERMEENVVGYMVRQPCLRIASAQFS